MSRKKKSRAQLQRELRDVKKAFRRAREDLVRAQDHISALLDSMVAHAQSIPRGPLPFPWDLTFLHFTEPVYVGPTEPIDLTTRIVCTGDSPSLVSPEAWSQSDDGTMGPTT